MHPGSNNHNTQLNTCSGSEWPSVHLSSEIFTVLHCHVAWKLTEKSGAGEQQQHESGYSHDIRGKYLPVAQTTAVR